LVVVTFSRQEFAELATKSHLYNLNDLSNQC
jgi:hypothetical protein